METHIILKKVNVIDPGGSYDGKNVDVKITDGSISEIGKDLDNHSCLVLHQEDSYISPGWMDGQAHFRDPGDEIKEGLERGLYAAAAGGYTDVAILPSTSPPIDNKTSVAYLISRGEQTDSPCEIHPLGCLSKNRSGEQLSELIDMADAGAIGFTDDRPINKVGLLHRALEYLRPSGDVVLSEAMDSELNPGAQMHEGVTSTQLGLTGSPTESESLRIQRDIELLSYAGGRIHIPIVSSALGIELIRKAKKKGLNITAATTPHHLTFIDEDLSDFDGTLRVKPPFRLKSDRKALRVALQNGTIDSIISDHRPENIESHDVEFMLSPNGISGIETVFAATKTACEKLDLNRLIDSISNATRRVYNIPEVHIELGAPAKITWFDPEKECNFQNISAGANNPWLNRKLQGKVYGCLNGTKIHLNDKN